MEAERQSTEAVLKQELGLNKLVFLKSCEGGMINDGSIYDTDKGNIFVKVNCRSEARSMFDGELISLNLLLKTETVKVPKPIKVIDLPERGAVLVMEDLQLCNLGFFQYAAKLGRHLAELHEHNEKMLKRAEKTHSSVHQESSPVELVDKFGFNMTTYRGIIPQSNEWTENWLDYWARSMELQVKLLETNFGDREIRGLWTQLLPKLPKFFQGLYIQPALLHGDLWDKNIGETRDEPVMFDPACFYGHSEFDLSLPSLCDSDWSEFLASYHQVIPRAQGFEQRLELYQLFHHANHWNHFPNQDEDQKQVVSTLHHLLAL